MPADTLHTVGQQVVELTFEHESDASETCDAMLGAFRGDAQAIIERCLAPYPTEALRITLPRIELNLPPLDPERPVASFLQAYEAALKAELEKLLAPGNGQQLSGKVQIHPDRGAIALLQHFLSVGALPWWCPASSFAGWHNVLNDAKRHAPAETKALIKATATNPQACKRLITALEWQSLEQAYQLAYGPLAEGILRQLQAWTASFPAHESDSDRRQHVRFWTDLFLAAIKSDAQPLHALTQPMAALRYLIDAFALRHQATVTSFVHHQLENPAFPVAVANALLVAPPPNIGAAAMQQLKILADAPTNPQTQSTGMTRVQPARSDVPPTTVQDEKHKAEISATSALLPQTHVAATGADAVPEPPSVVDASLYIHNAGLVLFAPFLRPFFTGLHLLDEENGFETEANRQRAALLLQYLIAPDEPIAEYQLPLARLLTGLPMTVPIDTELTPTNEEAEACEDLIDVVLNYWEGAGDISKDGFRGAWLKRNGILRIYNDHWLLRVENQPHDVLLDTLPWGIEMIFHEWMTDQLRVEWRAQ